MEEIVEVAQVIPQERLQQRTVEQMVNNPSPQVVDVTSERVRKRTDEQKLCTHQFLWRLPPRALVPSKALCRIMSHRLVTK